MSEPKRHLLPQKYVQEHQRRRLVIAIARLAHEHGTVNLTTARIVSGSHMSRGTLYELFESKDACLTFAFAQAYERIFNPVKAVREVQPWIDRVAASVNAFFTAIEAEPLLAELCLVHSLGEPGNDSVHQAGVETMTEAIAADPGPSELASPPKNAEELVARGIVSVAGRRVRDGHSAALPEEEDELVRLVAVSLSGAPHAKGGGASATPQHSRILERQVLR
jgi:AcrR family transcriptional regulator